MSDDIERRKKMLEELKAGYDAFEAAAKKSGGFIDRTEERALVRIRRKIVEVEEKQKIWDYMPDATDDITPEAIAEHTAAEHEEALKELERRRVPIEQMMREIEARNVPPVLKHLALVESHKRSMIYIDMILEGGNYVKALSVLEVTEMTVSVTHNIIIKDTAKRAKAEAWLAALEKRRDAMVKELPLLDWPLYIYRANPKDIERDLQYEHFNSALEALEKLQKEIEKYEPQVPKIKKDLAEYEALYQVVAPRLDEVTVSLPGHPELDEVNERIAKAHDEIRGSHPPGNLSVLESRLEELPILKAAIEERDRILAETE